jgi:hypothetical protein
VTVPFVYYGFGNTGIVTVVGILAFQYKSKNWKRQIREPDPIWKRFLVLSLCCAETFFFLYLTKKLHCFLF